MHNPRKESTNLTRTLTPAQARLLDLFTNDDVEVVASDLDTVFELACFRPSGPLSEADMQALNTLWMLRRQYQTIFLEGNLLA